jgi:UDP-N-acetyl-D-glucosamine/UDP-N-acetyl-D-galactosamine dehydrogenase
MNRTVSIIGLGYVGVPVAVVFGMKSHTIGFDVNPERMRELQDGIDRTGEVKSEDLARTDILFTHRIEDLRRADFHIIAVPTPLDEAH